jgi:hypothetical protein
MSFSKKNKNIFIFFSFDKTDSFERASDPRFLFFQTDFFRGNRTASKKYFRHRAQRQS